MYSVTACSDDVFRKMEENEKAFNERQKHELITSMTLEEMFPDPLVRELAAAAASGDIAGIDRYRKQGVDLNARGTKGVTPLFWAMHNLSGFEHLLSVGADPDIVFANGDGGTVLSAAVEARDDRFLMVALQHGANPNSVYDRRYGPVIFLAAGISDKKVDILLDAGANINARNPLGDTPALAEAEKGNFQSVYHLLMRGCHSRLKNNRGDDLRAITTRMLKIAEPTNPCVVWVYKVNDWLSAEDERSPAR